MSSGTPIKKGRATSAAERRQQRVEARAQRQQVRAMEARAAKTGPVVMDTVPDEPEFVEVGGSGVAVMRRSKPIARPVVLSRAQEYAYIRADMRRLVIVAAALFLLMLLLMLVIG